MRQQLTNMANAKDNINPGLSAIALVIRAREGPRFVFHYPPHPSGKSAVREARFGTELDTEPIEPENEDCYYEDSDPEDSHVFIGQTFGKLNLSAETTAKGDTTSKKSNHVEVQEGPGHYMNKKGEDVAPWDHLWEFPTADLESILTPSRAFHKKKFALSLDPMNFITYPIHIREDGFWKKRKTKKSKKSKKEDGEAEARSKANGTSDDGDEGAMTMFNVVFMLNLPKEEADSRIMEIYDHVIKKFNKALNHAQASSNYVWKESEMILAMKDKAREERRPMSWLWSNILLKSTLAGAIRDVFDAISQSNIATLSLATTPPLDLSLQIPVPCFLTSFPSSSDRAMLGLPLTSTNAFIDEEGNEDPTFLNKHFALLLLNNEEKIIAEIQSDNSDLTAPLLECIRICKPTLSFLQVAQAHSVELSSLLVLAQHLIYWRRAIAIPPIHARDYYIVSPNCDSRQLPTASVAWKKAFPLAPSLPAYLAALSAAPRPYKSFSPSKNHRPTYVEMLAWAMRGGWVIPMYTYAWIIVWPEIIYEVTYQLKANAVEKAKKKASSSEHASSTDESGTDKFPVDPKDMTTEQAAEKARLERLARKASEEAAEFASEFAELPKPVATVNPSINNNPLWSQLKIAPLVIKDPHKVSHEESLYIAAYAKRFTDPKLKNCWSKFCGKYFNGSEALEMIALQEGMKRKETWSILLNFQEIILVTKHW
ncbi:nitrogen permease regulator of amino acid transport activity 3-domain-containing protein [Amylocarpus encephaloides]|uniref:Nitrogen permease regulator 3 n=1 Tax=Amylocarpus encephaloides TaxID=45428 RepID=A0A9P7YFM9_9HELO|nr:nitrogen permease regulator of amino acid transport activity 3-domain-containing protein [Amylocarpus encephaloides]